MKLSIITSSMRLDSQTKRVGQYIQKVVSQKQEGEHTLLDLVDLKLPFFDDSLEDNTELQKIWNPISENLEASDGFVLVTPEWNGMASPMLKNFLMYVDSEMFHKPVLLVSVVGGMNGAYPIAELHLSGFKNNHAVVIPNHVIVRSVKSYFVTEQVEEGNKSDEVARERIENSVDILCAYAKALGEMRKDTKVEWNKFENGM